jgi:hypothetical protein
VVVVVAAIAGCGGGGGNDAATCKREAAELATLLRTMDHEVQVFVMDGVHLVTRTDVPSVGGSFAPTVVVTATGEIQAMGEALAGPALAERLELEHRRIADRGLGGELDPSRVNLVVDAAAPWSAVERAVGAAYGAGFVRPAFIFERPPTRVTPPPRSPIDDQLDALEASDDTSNKATRLAKMLEPVIRGCAPIERAFGRVAGVSGKSIADALIDAIEPSLVACNCRVDLPALRSILYRLFHVSRVTTALEVTLDPSGRALAPAPAAAWRDASQALPTDGSPVWIAPR